MACYRRKWTVWPGNLIESKKQPLKGPVYAARNLGILTLGGAVWQLMESLGDNISNGLCGRSVASKMSAQQAAKKIAGGKGI